MSATAWRRIQLAHTIGWVLLIAPSILFWRDSIPYLVGLSVWANVAGAVSAWQAARAEESAVDKEDLDPLRDAVETVLATQRQILARLPRI